VTPTIYLVGIDDLERIPEFLDLGLIVVVSPDPTTLHRWQHEQELGDPTTDQPAATSGVVVEMAARRISYRGVPLTLSDREFRVLAGLVQGRGRAFSFEEIRRLGWREGTNTPIDIYSIRVADPAAPSQAPRGGGAGHDHARSKLRIPTGTRSGRYGRANRPPVQRD